MAINLWDAINEIESDVQYIPQNNYCQIWYTQLKLRVREWNLCAHLFHSNYIKHTAGWSLLHSTLFMDLYWFVQSQSNQTMTSEIELRCIRLKKNRIEKETINVNSIFCCFFKNSKFDYSNIKIHIENTKHTQWKTIYFKHLSNRIVSIRYEL